MTSENPKKSSKKRKSNDKNLENFSPPKISKQNEINYLTNKQFSPGYYELLKTRMELPVWGYKQQFFDILSNNQIVVLIGETGSGKTTQIPQWCVEWLWANAPLKCVGCTQPRRVAAMSVAERVAKEMDVEFGSEVGYCIRFDDFTTSKTKLKYLTDGVLLREATYDPILSKYGVIIIDEAHERTLSTDILMGLIKQITETRQSDLKIIVMSATLDSEKFQTYFNNAPVLNIPGRLFPVEIFYSSQPEEDYVDCVVRIAVSICRYEPTEGDVLIFLTGQDEIDEVCRRIDYEISTVSDSSVGTIVCIPLYSTLPVNLQQRIFEKRPPNTENGGISRKIVVATNIAETSITIDGVAFVVDPGFSKQKVYNARSRVESLTVMKISRASAKQRTGRAGRTGPGKCFRLYTKHSFDNELLENTFPEILRSNLGSVLLDLKKLRIVDIVRFDFIDPPHPENTMRAMETLYYLGAIDGDGNLTQLGEMMAEFPLDPQLSKALIIACEYGCQEDMLSVVAMLSVPNCFFRPNFATAAADGARLKFTCFDSDHLTLRNVFDEFVKNKQKPKWCSKNYLNFVSLKAATSVKGQLKRILVKLKLCKESPESNSSNTSENIKKALVSGFFMQSAYYDKKKTYLTIMDNQSVSFYPATGLKKKPDWVIYNEFVMTNKYFIRTVTEVNPQWLVSAAPEYYQLANFSNCTSKLAIEKLINPSRKAEHYNY